MGESSYKTEGERVLLAYLCAKKRMNPELPFELVLRDTRGDYTVVFEPGETRGMQHYFLQRMPECVSAYANPSTALRMSEVDTPYEIHVDQSRPGPRALVTGCSGLLGSMLAEKLLEKGYQVIGIDNGLCSKQSNLSKIIDNPNFYFCSHDVTKPFTIMGRLDMVLHLASIPSPALYYRMPLETLDVGILGTLYTLDIAVQKGGRYLFASTSEVYGNPEVNPQPENYWGNVDPMGIRSPYDESKRGSETLIELYHKKYDLDVRIARIFNTYGPGMRLSDGRVITSFLQSLLKDKPLIVHGSGNQTRSFAYVTDTVDGLVRLLDYDDWIMKQVQDDTYYAGLSQIQERVFNIGNPTEFTINELAQIVVDLGREKLGKNATIEHIDQFDATDPYLRRPDITKAQKLLNFNPTVSLTEGLTKTLDYFLHTQT